MLTAVSLPAARPRASGGPHIHPVVVGDAGFLGQGVQLLHPRVQGLGRVLLHPVQLQVEVGIFVIVRFGDADELVALRLQVFGHGHQQVAVLVGIAVAMTIGVYGLVGAIVKMDDAGLYLSKRGGAGVQALGRVLLTAAPKLMKFLSVAGTVAMFMVGGGILTHGIPGAHDLIHHAAEAAGSVAGVGPLLAAVTPTVLDAVGGVIAGAIVLAVVTVGSKLLRALKR